MSGLRLSLIPRSPYLRWGIWIVALCLQLWRTDTFFEYTNSDRNRQIQGAFNSMNDKGLTQVHAHPDDLSQSIYIPLWNWPPAYNVGITPLYLLTGDWFTSIEIFHLAGIIALFVLILAVLTALEAHISPWVHVFIFGYWAISFAPFQYLGTTDLWAGVSLLFAAYALLKSEARSIFWILMSLGALWLAMSFRYAYYPYVVLPGIYLWLAGNRKWAGTSSLILAGLMIPLVLFQMYQADGLAYESFREGTGAPFWEHLLQFDLFPIKAYCYVSFSKLAGMMGLENGGLLWGISLIPSLIIVWIIGGDWIKSAWKWTRQQSTDPLTTWAWLSLVICGINLCFLIYLSLRYAAESWGGVSWTYVEESRYYIPIYILLHIGIPVLISKKNLMGINRLILQAFLACCVMFSLAHSASRIYEYTIIGNKRAASDSAYELAMRSVYEEVRKREGLPNHVVYVYGNNRYADIQIVAGWGGAGIRTLDQFVENPQTSEVITLLIYLTDEEYSGLIQDENLRTELQSIEQITILPEGRLYLIQHFGSNL